jgi:23S rRNA (adenine2503-C2)-methyltransferase
MESREFLNVGASVRMNLLMPESLLGLTRAALGGRLEAWGYKPVHAKAIWQHAHRMGLIDPGAIEGLPSGLAERLRRDLTITAPTTARETTSSDGFTRKFLLTLHDGRQIETVLMRYDGRVTACVSTQAGCAMGCVFCATGQMGFSRHLTAAEIVTQILAVHRTLNQHPAPRTTHSALRNIVFMGMGEPLHNYDAVMTATEILADTAGLGISPRRMTVSTVGVVPGIRRLTSERRPVSLAVSLHAATQEGRLALLPPAAKAWPLDELMDACRDYSAALDRHIFFEWTLIEGANDGESDARALAALLASQRAHVNLIPLNPTHGYAGLPPSTRAAKAFQAVLAGAGIPSTVRQRRGIDIASGCGQLATQTTAT